MEAEAVTATDPETREVADYVDALNHGVTLLEQLPLWLRLVRELHEKLLGGVRGAEEPPDEVRRVRNFIGRADIASARFVPPPPDRLEPLLRRERHPGQELSAPARQSRTARSPPCAGAEA